MKTKYQKYTQMPLYILTWIFWGWLCIWYLIGDIHWIGQLFAVWPAWFWLLGIWLPIVISHHTWKKTLILTSAWIVFLFVFSEEWTWCPSLFTTVPATYQNDTQHKFHELLKQTGKIPSSWKQAYPLRIISYNLNGNLNALKKSANYHPDICFFQEAPSQKWVTQSILSTFGNKAVYLDSGDCATLSILPIQSYREVSLKNAGPMLEGTIEIPKQEKLTLLNVRLLLPLLNLTPWNPSTWSETRRNQKDRELQLSILEDVLRTKKDTSGIILGGDFNRPARSVSLHPLKTYLIDSFIKAGTGWGNTMTVDFPVSRIDQIWISPSYRSINSRVVMLPDSDHRMLITDIQIPVKQ